MVCVFFILCNNTNDGGNVFLRINFASDFLYAPVVSASEGLLYNCEARAIRAGSISEFVYYLVDDDDRNYQPYFF
ncbi:hypothetical protein AGMMS49593_08370 [Endomicrobiia bacterium]|nr:hypothetical protein AGMMS49593_08370 [Endomicrobiia bacterium]